MTTTLKRPAGTIESGLEGDKKRAKHQLTSEPTFHTATGTIQQRGAITLGEANAEVKTTDGIATVVDALCCRAKESKVAVVDGVALDAMLSQVCSTTNASKFYKLQCLANEGGEKYFVWTRWGRIGEATKFANALKGPMEKDKAVELFHSTFRSKAGVKWADRASAVPGRKGKYALIIQEVVVAPPTEEKTNETAEPVEAATDDIDPSVRKLLMYILDGAARKRELDAMGIDVSSGILRLGTATIAAAHSELEKINALLSNEQPVAQMDSSDDGISKAAALRAASDRFYTLIPTKGGRAILPCIDTHELLSSKLEQLEALANPTGFDDTTNDKPTVDPVKVYLDGCNLSLAPVDSASPEFKDLADYVETTSRHGYKLTLKDAFMVSGTAANVQSGDKILAFHGTRRVNLSGVLANGLRLKNSSVKTGAMFDNGIYG